MGQMLHTTACCKLVAPSLLLSDTYIDESPATQTHRTFQNERLQMGGRFTISFLLFRISFFDQSLTFIFFLI